MVIFLPLFNSAAAGLKLIVYVAYLLFPEVTWFSFTSVFDKGLYVKLIEHLPSEPPVEATLLILYVPRFSFALFISSLYSLAPFTRR